MAKKIHDICPHTSVHTFEEFVLPNTLEGLFERILSLPAPDEDKTGAGTAHSTEHRTKSQAVQPDSSSITYILDAIDNVSAKIALAVYADKHSIPLISSMGTGNKLHPELFRISDLKETSVCPLCRVMRKELKARGIKNLKICWSPEPPLAPGPTEEDTGSRRATPGSIAFVPPVAGLMIAGAIVREICSL